MDLAVPADDQNRDRLLVPQHGLEMHRDRAGRLHDFLGDLLVPACILDEERLLLEEHAALDRALLFQGHLYRGGSLEAVVRAHDEVAVGAALHERRKPGARDRAGRGADDLACELWIGRARDLAGRLRDRGHADDQLARLLLAHLELLGAP